MLLEIVESTKEKLIVELSLGPSMVIGEPEKKLQVNMINVFLGLLNSNISWNSVTEQIIKQDILAPSKVNDFISILKLKKEAKEFLQFFCFHHAKIYTPHLLKMELLLSDVKDIAQKNSVNNEIVLEYINIKYSPREIKSDDDNFRLRPFQPLLMANDIDSEEFYEMMRNGYKKKINRDNVLEWLKPQINNKIHLTLFEKILSFQFAAISGAEFLKSLPLDELLEYLKLKLEYENSCTKYRFSFLDEVLVLSYIELLKNHTSIKRCGFCGKYFISIYGAKACSKECKNDIIEANKERRKNNATYLKSTKAIKSVRDKVTYYEGICKDAQPDSEEYHHRQNILSGYKYTYHYYCWVCTKVNDAILNNTDNILNDKEFITNFENWLNIISTETCDLDRTPSLGDVKYYKFSRDGFEPKSCLSLLAYEEFTLDINQKFSKEGELVKKKDSEKRADRKKLEELQNNSNKKS